MGQIIKHVVVTLFFAGQLALVVFLNRDVRASHEGMEKAIANYGFYLTESAKDCGIDFKHESPQRLDEFFTRKQIVPLIASMGAAVSVVDFDKDGWPDIYTVTSKEGGKNRLYRNLGNGKFEDVAAKVGLADLNQEGTGVCMGAVWGDFDGDGYEDVFVYKWGKPELFRNDGGKRFVRVTDQANLPKWSNANAAIWLDYDRDGKLDLFLAGYWKDDVNLWKLTTTEIMPEQFEFAFNGGKKYLLRNKGDGTFEDVTAAVGITSTRWTLGVAAADLCRSGYPDIILANDYGVSEYLCNDNGKKFTEKGGQDHTTIGVKPKSGMNVSFGDLFNSGRFAIYISNITDAGNLVQGNNLWVPDPVKPGMWAKYNNLADSMGIASGGWSWSAQFGDLNNDGYQDLYLTNGYISASKKRDYWYQYGLIAGGVKLIIKDADNWPKIEDRSLAGYQTKRLWLNRQGKMIDVAQAAGVRDQFDGRAVALVDLWNRGVLDVVVANQNGPLLIYKNTVAEGRNWVQFELTSKAGNTSAIGAMVRVFWNMKGSDRLQEQVQVITGGNAYASQNMRRLHFGLGAEAKIEKVVIHWPSGGEQTLTDVKVDTLHTIAEAAQ